MFAHFSSIHLSAYMFALFLSDFYSTFVCSVVQQSMINCFDNVWHSESTENTKMHTFIIHGKSFAISHRSHVAAVNVRGVSQWYSLFSSQPSVLKPSADLCSSMSTWNALHFMSATYSFIINAYFIVFNWVFGAILFWWHSFSNALQKFQQMRI